MEPNDTNASKTPVIQQKFDCVEFVKSFVPKNSSQEYIQKVADCYRDASSLAVKKEIVHDGRANLFGQQMIPPNTVTQDYGWNFPCIPRVQKHLLTFCAQASKPVTMMNIGAGFGVDSMCALLKKNVRVLVALEKQGTQAKYLKTTVEQSIRINVDSLFPLEGFKPIKKDFLTLEPSKHEGYPGGFDVLNANKLIHFFDPGQTKNFAEKAHALLRPGGRLFLTCLTPSPDSEIEKFMKTQEGNDFPGYVFYTQRTDLENVFGTLAPGKSTMIKVRKPVETEKAAHFCQKDYIDYALTDRVMHYHTAQTLEKNLGDGFKILETIITTPEENYGTDHMISIVAERK
jgi:SAM-dependent methyltransferase